MVEGIALTTDIRQALKELLETAHLKTNDILVVGCSTSEVIGRKIGSASDLQVANALIDGILPLVKENHLYLAAQCCEHLNRAIVVEENCAMMYGLEVVSVVPHPKAGGSFAAVVMERLVKPVVVEGIEGHAGMDIGDTFIGMHLKRVAVPVRVSLKNIGEAHLTLARTRPKLIGGERAKYK